jgi:hypothetical protein
METILILSIFGLILFLAVFIGSWQRDTPDPTAIAWSGILCMIFISIFTVSFYVVANPQPEITKKIIEKTINGVTTTDTIYQVKYQKK